MVTKEPPPLKPEEIAEALRAASPTLAKELYELVQRQLNDWIGRQSRTDTKATGLLGAAGLAVTVAFAFGGQILLNGGAKLRPGLVTAAVGCFVVAIVFGFGVAALALSALFIRDSYMAVNERAIFDAELLNGGDTPAEYQKSMAIHIWEIVQNHAAMHQQKVRLIRTGQGFFLAFIAAMLGVCMCIVIGVLTR